LVVEVNVELRVSFPLHPWKELPVPIDLDVFGSQSQAGHFGEDKSIARSWKVTVIPWLAIL
jgi:hypothetical protein